MYFLWLCHNKDNEASDSNVTILMKAFDWPIRLLLLDVNVNMLELCDLLFLVYMMSSDKQAHLPRCKGNKTKSIIPSIIGCD